MVEGDPLDGHHRHKPPVQSSTSSNSRDDDEARPDEREAAIAASSTAAEVPLGPTEAAFPPYHWPRCHKAEDGYNYSDYDIDVKHRHDHRQCCDECSKTHGCVFYVWTPGHYGGKCHLKSKVGKQHRLPGAKAAKVNKPVVECEKLQHHKYNHRDYFDHFMSHARDCCQSCLAHYKTKFNEWGSEAGFSRRGHPT